MGGPVEVFEEQRPRLLGLAYRMLGEVQEAEDAVQDAYLRWSGADGVEDPRAWLTRVVTNLCLNRLTSARARRETYPGPWLPEPADPAVLGPLETAAQRESVSLALLALMESLTPSERAVFVLREAFAYPHAEIAAILDVSEPASRQLYRRARRHVGERRFAPGREEARRLVERFLEAAGGGDVAGLERLLAEDVVAWSDGGGKVTSARRPVRGRGKVARYLLGLASRVAVLDEIGVAEVNGVPAVVGRMAGDVAFVMVPAWSGAEAVAFHTVVNPEKLRSLSRSGGPSGPSR
ncbi:RNA polymerase sigma-70 factor [Spirillospora sp. NPDC127200]